MKLSFVIVALLAVTAVPCYARLGETFDQLETRYGKVLLKFPGMHNGYPGDYRALFKKDSLCIAVTIYKGVAVEERINKQDLSDLDQSELTALMDADSANLTWTEGNSGDANSRIFTRDDGALAKYTTNEHCLYIWSKDYLDAIAAKQKAEQDAKLPGM